MSVVSELIRTEADGTISFGNYELPAKSKKSDFEHDGDLYKVKTFKEITKLERNGMFVYESVPGTAVSHLKATEWYELYRRVPDRCTDYRRAGRGDKLSGICR
mgnify:CR=1 FL=1